MRRLIELAAKERRQVVGLMSGTSADGVDAVVVELSGCGQAMRYEVLAFSATEFPEDLRREVFALFAPQASLDALCRVNFALGEVLAQAALDAIEFDDDLHDISLQGPASVDFLNPHTAMDLPALKYFHQESTTLFGRPAIISRTGYSGERFETIGEGPGRQSVYSVKTRIVDPDGSHVAITYIAKRSSNRWCLIDVVVDDGISELAVRQSEYRLILQKRGIEGLIRALNVKADQLMSQ